MQDSIVSEAMPMMQGLLEGGAGWTGVSGRACGLPLRAPIGLDQNRTHSLASFHSLGLSNLPWFDPSIIVPTIGVVTQLQLVIRVFDNSARRACTAMQLKCTAHAARGGRQADAPGAATHQRGSMR